jgi:3-oxoacyl-[acyl-carrier-protein] synthase-3
MIRMSAVEAVIPDTRPSIFDLQDRYQMTAAELGVFHRLYGLERVPVWSAPVGELVEAAVEQLLKTSGVDRDRVRWLVHTHTGTDQSVVGDPMLQLICRRLGLRAAQPFGMTTNNCASTISAMRVVDRLLATGAPGDRAIVVTGDVAFTQSLQVIPNSSVTGDAAVACLLGRDGDGHRVLSSRVFTYGQHAACQYQDDAAATEFETEYAPRLVHVMQASLADAGLSWPDIRLVLPHNVNHFSWRRVAAAAGIPLDLVYLDQVGQTAHCFGADVLLNLVAAERDRGLRTGDRLLLATVGLGAVFAAAVLEYQAPEEGADR